MQVLIVVAHPDDEVLGVGGTASTLAGRGVAVRSCILSSTVKARQHRPDLSDLNNDVWRAQGILGLGEPILGEFPNIRFNTVSHLDLVKFIESAIQGTGADVIFTHHPGDLNDDHLHTSRACQAAARLYQRRPSVPRLKALYFMEILSSTDWAFPKANPQFLADTFFPISDALDSKLEALKAYRGVMREFPHPRSEEILRGLAAYRGGQAGITYAEAFQTAFHVLGSLAF